MKKVIGIFILINLSFTGCITPWILNLGVTERELEPKEVYVFSDDGIVIEAQLIQKSGTVKRYLYRDADSFRWDVYKATDTGGLIRLPLQISSGRIGTSGWKMRPQNYKPRDATYDDLPAHYALLLSSHPASVSPYRVPFTYNGKTVAFSFESLLSPFNGLSSERALWSYPCQIFIIPAFILEAAVVIAFFPIFLYVAFAGPH